MGAAAAKSFRGADHRSWRDRVQVKTCRVPSRPRPCNQIVFEKPPLGRSRNPPTLVHHSVLPDPLASRKSGWNRLPLRDSGIERWAALAPGRPVSGASTERFGPGILATIRHSQVQAYGRRVHVPQVGVVHRAGSRMAIQSGDGHFHGGVRGLPLCSSSCHIYPQFPGGGGAEIGRRLRAPVSPGPGSTGRPAPNDGLKGRSFR